MQSVIAFVIGTAYFASISAVAGGSMWLIGEVILLTYPPSRDLIWPWFIAGLMGLAISIVFAKWIIEWPSKRQVAARE